MIGNGAIKLPLSNSEAAIQNSKEQCADEKKKLKMEIEQTPVWLILSRDGQEDRKLKKIEKTEVKLQ